MRLRCDQAHGASVNVRDDVFFHALQTAVSTGDEDLVKRFIRASMKEDIRPLLTPLAAIVAVNIVPVVVVVISAVVAAVAGISPRFCFKGWASCWS